MGVLQRFERRLEGLVSGAFTRVFKGKVEPVEVAAQLQRETDDRKTVVGEGRILVPNDFVVELGTSDFERLSPYAEPLGAELADMVAEHAAEQGYSFVGPVRVTLEHVDDLDTGRFLVRSGVTTTGGEAVAGPSPAPVPAPVRTLSEAPWMRPAAGQEATPSRRKPPWLEVLAADGGKQTRTLARPVTVIGRGSECELRLEDTGVSRRHAEIRVDGECVTVTDLGSTNGTAVNGKPVDSAVLAEGDRLTLGTTTMVFRRDDP